MSEDANGRREAGRIEAQLEQIAQNQAAMSADIRTLMREWGELKTQTAVILTRLQSAEIRIEKELADWNEHEHPDLAAEVKSLGRRDAIGTAAAGIGAIVAAVIAFLKT